LAGSDYSTTSDTIVFPAGVTSRTILVSTIDDSAVDPDETFFVNLSNADGAIIVGPQGEATILNDDVAPNVPPVPDAGGSYLANEGSIETLDASGSSDSDGTIVSHD